MRKTAISIIRTEVVRGVDVDSGKTVFLVVLIDRDGYEAFFGGGPSYSQAIPAAEECALDWGVHVVDRVTDRGCQIMRPAIIPDTVVHLGEIGCDLLVASVMPASESRA